MKYGYFDDANREYIITDPKTPTKWINYVGTLAFGGILDHTGGALICRGDPANNRIIKYIPQLPSSDLKGTTLYLRLKTADGYRVFSAYFTPTLDPYDHFECHVGMGYTRLVTEFYGIRTDALIFVPRGDTRLIRDITVTNLNDQPVTLDAIPVVEYTHFQALKQFNNADWVPQTMQSQAHFVDGHTILTQYAFMNKQRRVNYFTASLPVSSFESDRRRFLGDNEYGTWANPLSLHQPELSNTEALRGDNIGALLVPLGTLQPGETQRLITQLGQAASVEAALPGIRHYWEIAGAEAAFADLNAFWREYLETITVETPNVAMNSMLNVHNPRQCHTTKNWSRYLSLYQLGLGARGLGFRDSSQDVMGVVTHMPDEVKAFIKQILHVQRRDGSAMHQYNPLTMEAQIGDAAEDPERLDFYGDDHLWIILATGAYLRETGDFALLGDVIPYYEKGRGGLPLESGTVCDHLLRAIEFTHGNTGAHGLPLLGFADWNDPTNLLPGAESFFVANLYGVALRELIALFNHLGDRALVTQFLAYYDEMKACVNAHGWDGAWYLRYFTAEGKPIGSHVNEKGRVWTNGQSWPVLSGFAPPGRAQMALDAVRQHLNTPKGIKLIVPGYDGYDEAFGGVSTYPPGTKENGGIFLHANPWVIIAETKLGRGEIAFEYYDQINPAARNGIIDEYECEPYCYAQNILGNDHPQFGLARNSWLSGTASWMYQAATQYILGVRAGYTGLTVDPCIPAAWDGFRMTRRFRGVTYAINVQNPDHVNRGVKSIAIDGVALTRPVIPIFGEGETHRVEVIMGRA
jgi:cellobiose phosphorylase